MIGSSGQLGVRLQVFSTLLFLAAVQACFGELPPLAVIGDDRLSLAIGLEGGEVREQRFCSRETCLEGLEGLPWSALIDQTDAGPRGGEVRVVKTEPGDGGRMRRVCLEGAVAAGAWRLEYRVTGPGRITKTLALIPKRTVMIREVRLWDARQTNAPWAARTPLADIAVFYRQQGRGMFVSLDFPSSRIEVKADGTRVCYPPHARVRAGQTYTAHTLTLGATELTGRERYGRDEGEVTAMDAYIQERFPPRFERPMILSASINNRYTQPRGDVIFYTMRDHPTLNYNTELLRRELQLMPKLGVEYYQVFPGVFDWTDQDPDREAIRNLMKHARRHGVRMGDYSGTSTVFCPHYNHHRNRLNHPEWQVQLPDGRRPASFCFGNPAFVDYYIATVVPNARRFGFEIHCLDFLTVQPCWDATHGHPAGADSVYHAVAGLVRVLEAINDVSPEMMTWSNSGNWADLLPKIAWFNPNLYLTDPFIATPWPGLNMTRLLDDARREQMVELHYKRFIPYRFLSNFQYFFSQNSIVPDRRNYRYGALSTLAVTPNLGLGEIRPWLDRQSPQVQAEAVAFYRKWTGFVRRHFALWKQTYHVADDPHPGGVEIYSHADGAHGFVFVVNPNYHSREVSVPLDHTLGFSGTGLVEMAELYPVERRRLPAQGPHVPLGSRLSVTAEAQQVLVLEVRPAPGKIRQPLLYGLPGELRRAGGRWLLRTEGMQGQTERFCVLTGDKDASIQSACVLTNLPRQPERQWSATPIERVGRAGGTAVFAVTFRREPVPTELREWRVRAGTLEQGVAGNWPTAMPEEPSTRRARFPVAEADGTAGRGIAVTNLMANFLGAYIDNAFGEMQETWIELRTTGPATTGPPPTASEPGAHPSLASSSDLLAADFSAGCWLQTELVLPFMYTIGAEPPSDEHTILVLPLADPGRVKAPKLWINGLPSEPSRYRYPRNRALATWHADLVGSPAHGGTNTLTLFLSAQ